MNLFRQTIAKGNYGYVEKRAKTQLVYAIMCALVVAFLVILGIQIYGTKLNIIMVPAMFMVIPFANYFVAFIAVSNYRSGSEQQREALKNFEDAGLLLCDLVFVNEKGKRMYAEFAVVYKNGIVLYSANQKLNVSNLEIHLNGILKRRGVPMRSKVYLTFEDFLRRVDGVEQPDDETGERRVELAKEAILSTCI